MTAQGKRLMRDIERYLAFKEEVWTVMQKVIVTDRDGQQTVRYDWRKP